MIGLGSDKNDDNVLVFSQFVLLTLTLRTPQNVSAWLYLGPTIPSYALQPMGPLWPSDNNDDDDDDINDKDDDVPVLSQFVCVGAGGQESPLES